MKSSELSNVCSARWWSHVSLVSSPLGVTHQVDATPQPWITTPHPASHEEGLWGRNLIRIGSSYNQWKRKWFWNSIITFLKKINKCYFYKYLFCILFQRFSCVSWCCFLFSLYNSRAIYWVSTFCRTVLSPMWAVAKCTLIIKVWVVHPLLPLLSLFFLLWRASLKAGTFLPFFFLSSSFHPHHKSSPFSM